ncbi:MAG: HAMP domain-containing histidine kinase [Spirochaetes bacterium]|nr:HAMP domain-containing histidine kinase [Spirochaetota bacterium]
MKISKNSKITLIYATSINLIKIITLLNIIGLIILFSYQFINTKNNLNEEFKVLFEQIKETLTPHIWVYDEKEITKILNFYIKYDIIYQIQLFYNPYFHIKTKEYKPNYFKLFESPIIFNNNEIGYLKIIFYYDYHFNLLIKRYIIYFLIFFIYSLLITFIMNLIINKKLKKTFDELEYNLESISKGFYKIKIKKSKYYDINKILESFNRTINEVEKRELKLKDLYNYFRNTLNSFSSMILICDSSFLIEFINKNMYNFLYMLIDYRFINLSYESLNDILEKQDPSIYNNNYNMFELLPFLNNKEILDSLNLKDHFSKVNFHLIIDQKNSNKNIEYYLNIFMDKLLMGEEIKYILRIDDNTSTYFTYKKLAFLDKINTLSLFINSLTHDLNNIISAISLLNNDSKHILENNQFIKQNEKNELLENINYIENTLDKARELTKKFINLSKSKEFNESKFEKINLINLLNNLLDITKKSYKNIKTGLVNEIEYEPYLLGDYPLLDNAFLNIIINAFHAMTIMKQEKGEKEEGELKIIIKKFDNKYYNFNLNLNPNTDYLIIEIKDNGVGIKKEHISKIFEPYFTTKKETIGSGLGLFMVYNTIHLHNGAIEVISEEGKGTTFYIILPEFKGN